jgi:hypothetical protein
MQGTLTHSGLDAQRAIECSSGDFYSSDLKLRPLDSPLNGELEIEKLLKLIADESFQDEENLSANAREVWALSQLYSLDWKFSSVEEMEGRRLTLTKAWRSTKARKP